MRFGLCSSALGALALAAATPVVAQSQAPSIQFRVPAGPLNAALPLFAAQSGEQILYSTDLVAGRQSPGVSGALGTDQALTALLQGTGLRARRSSPNTLVVFDPGARAETSDDATQLAEIVVTGSLIRGVGDGPSPVITVTRDDIDRQGHGTVAQALAALPQSFGGTGNDAAMSNGGDRTGTNSFYASGVNLRGLGSDATLVLVNGRRMAGTGNKGDFADVSTIPTSAVARIDVLLDGASALYGADAVGGVVNIILRDDYEGAETRVRYGATSDGASDEVQIAQTFGRRWTSGSILGTYEFNDRSRLLASERDRASDADLRRFGGSDRRRIFSNPGNIVVFDAAAGGYVPTYAIPRGQNGVGLRPTDFVAGQGNLYNHREGLNVIPEQTRHSAYLVLNQDLGDRVSVNADVRYGLRDFEAVSQGFPTTFTVTSANPFFVSPTGASSHIIAYNFGQDLGNPRIKGRAESLGASVGAKIDLVGSWRLDTYAAYAREHGENDSSNQLNSTFLREALGAIADNPATPYSAPRDGYFNPFADGSNSSPAALAFIGSGWSRGVGETTISSINALADGSLFTLPAGEVKLAVGAAFRRETFERQDTSFTSGVAPSVGAPVAFDREVASAFAELRIPLFGAENRRAGFERLELSIAGRFEEYSDAGQPTSPKVGILWQPYSELVLRANYGESFRAPALRELHETADQSPSFLPRGSQQVLTEILYGGNPDLEPEQARSWTLGGDYRPDAVPGLRLGLNLFRIEFDNQIGQPAFTAITTALTNPALADFVRIIDPINNAQDREDMQALLDLPTTALADLFPAEAYGAIVDARFVNTSSVLLEGIDANLGYAFDLGDHAFELDANLTYMDRFDTQATPTAPVQSGINGPNLPVDLRGRASASWSRLDWGASAALNYVDGYPDVTGRPIGSWTTADVQVRYAPTHGPLEGTTLTLNVQNLLNTDPPFYDAPEGVAYDAANTNVLGRFVSIQLTRSW
ncbi:TonB-dependent receptor [Brevundimonas sp.]|uniref:TonB-dependent receptor n=1 Tax=Brevundimonas sp. TaxID=1871086 RepID=UPI001A2FA81E|nr:TonB-dependent receptor [Brevundimonas sp.]MBJ7483470.1 TonB-dependent receptor [Brevundimonas sp.]